MKFHIVVITVLLSLGFLFQSVESSIAQSNIEKFPLSRIWGKEKILDMVYMRTRGEGVLCIGTSYVKKVGDSNFAFEKLIFYRHTGNSFTKIHEFEPGGGTFLGLYALYNGDLMTLWAGASAFGVFVFSLEDKEIKIVLQEGGVKTNPEIADIDNDGLPEILISSGVMIRPDSSRIEPETTSVYKRIGKSYVLIKTVPWERRFDDLKPKK